MLFMHTVTSWPKAILQFTDVPQFPSTTTSMQWPMTGLM